MKLKDLKIERGDRTDYWLEVARKGESVLPYILNKTESQLEREIREKLKLWMTNIYRGLDYGRVREDAMRPWV